MAKLKDNTATSIDPIEIAKFSAMADEWWDETGKFAPLHKFNPARISYILERAKAKFGNKGSKPLAGLKILDIGCGGGLLCEPMARLGATVTGIDASEKNIKIASLHAEREGLDINYQCTSIEQLAAKGASFDIVLNMEVIEHVADVKSFMAASCAVVKPGGLMFIATLNRTPKSFLFAIVGAEYVLRWLPKGTHEWSRFLKPSEIEVHLHSEGVKVKEITGMSYNLLKDSWSVSEDLSINYIIFASRD